VRLCLRTAAVNGHVVYPSCDMWAWGATLMMVMVGYKSWLVHQSSLAVLPEETSETSRRNGQRSGNSAYLRYLKESLTCLKNLRNETSGFTSHPKEGVLQIFIALKNPSPQPSFNPWPLGSLASILTGAPPRRLMQEYTWRFKWKLKLNMNLIQQYLLYLGEKLDLSPKNICWGYFLDRVLGRILLPKIEKTIEGYRMSIR
jgi:hypothetical protein